MKQVVRRGGSPELVDSPAPGPAPGRALVETLASVISTGTERAAVSGGGRSSLPARAIRNPDLLKKAMGSLRESGVKATLQKARDTVAEDSTLGYSCAGIVLDAGGIPGLEAGQLVACAGVGAANHAEIVSVPANLLAPVPAGVDPRHAAFTTLGAIAIQGLRRSRAELGDRVGVVGLGLLGLITAQLLRAAGCQVIGVEPVAERRQLAKSFGVEHVVDPADAPAAVKIISEDFGADAAIVTAASTSSAIVNDSIRLLRRKGRLVVVGAVGLELERPDLYQREADVLISTSYGPGRYDPTYEEGGLDYPIGYVRWTENRNMREFLRQLASGSLDVEPLIGLELPVDRSDEAYAAIAGENPPMAAVLTYPEDGRGVDAKLERSLPPQPATAREGRVSVALIGAGAFVRGVHIPNLLADGRADVSRVVNRSGVSAGNVARSVGSGNGVVAGTDPAVAFADPAVDLVVIGSRHDSHAELAAAALRAGKAVFCEKPLGLTREQIDDVWEAAQDNPRLAIGFNRPLSPLSRHLQLKLGTVSGPTQVIYRVNAPLPRVHWLNDPDVGGGRILGEACHMFDYVNWLLGEPRRVFAAALTPPPDGAAVESVSVTITYDGGSHATVHYTGAGASTMPKERIEVYRGGSSWVLDDFVSLTSYGSGPVGPATESLKVVDKGHAALLARVISATLGEECFDPGIGAAYAAQAIGLAALDSLSAGTVERVRLPGRT
ncbi:MAG: bi-domain-containing oxidoreductase [Actinomycetota bacterium]|nr:bi-domain-containing oxidoreductase [Actinomycetota bacterium]